MTRLVKEGTKKTTLAIGDGANDVGMIQEADIGVGISGVEGMQAVMASDFSISQFRFLQRLLVVHGHWCYKRVAQMVTFFLFFSFGRSLLLKWFAISSTRILLLASLSSTLDLIHVHVYVHIMFWSYIY